MRWTVDDEGWWYGTPEGTERHVATIIPRTPGFSADCDGNYVGRFDDLAEAKRACEEYHAKRGGLLMPNPGDYEATFGSAEQQEIERLRREVAIAHKERAAIWDALSDVDGPHIGEMANTLPDAVRALVRAYSAARAPGTIQMFEEGADR